MRKAVSFSALLAVVTLPFVPFSLTDRETLVSVLYVVTGFGGLAALGAGVATWDRRSSHAWIHTDRHLAGANAMMVPVAGSVWILRAIALTTMAIIAFVSPQLLGSIDGGSDRLRSRVELLTPLLPAVGIVVAGYVLVLLLRKSKFLGIALSSEGLYSCTWGGCSFYSWDDIRRVDPSIKGGVGVQLWLPSEFDPPAHSGESLLGRVGWFRRKKNSWLPLGTLAVHPVVVYEALRFYHKHPELRHELGTEAALERARTANYPDVIEELAKDGERAPAPPRRFGKGG